MAYTIWKVFMKKYTKAKYGFASKALPVSFGVLLCIM